ncbi:AtuA-related protein [Haliea sp.]
MAKVQLAEIAVARSGDKGDGSNIGVMAKSPGLYALLEQTLTAAVVKDYFREICFGDVTRYELPNLQSLNFILDDSLGGGGTETLITDAQGKVHGLGLLHLELDVPDELLR